MMPDREDLPKKQRKNGKINKKYYTCQKSITLAKIEKMC